MFKRKSTAIEDTLDGLYRIVKEHGISIDNIKHQKRNEELLNQLTANKLIHDQLLPLHMSVTELQFVIHELKNKFNRLLQHLNLEEQLIPGTAPDIKLVEKIDAD
jgi:uncharacterized coiled-coil protein SlyX